MQNRTPQAIKLSHKAEQEHIENTRRIEVEQRKASFLRDNENAKQGAKVTAIQLASKFQHLVKDEQSLDFYIDKFTAMLETAPVNFQEPAKPLDLV